MLYSCVLVAIRNANIPFHLIEYREPQQLFTLALFSLKVFTMQFAAFSFRDKRS